MVRLTPRVSLACLLVAAPILVAGAQPAASSLAAAARPPMADSGAAERGRKSPWVAGALAYVFPGAGHFYADEPRRGWLVMGLAGLGANLALNDAGSRELATGGAVLALGTYVVSIVDAPLAARRTNARRRRVVAPPAPAAAPDSGAIPRNRQGTPHAQPPNGAP